MPRGKYPPRVRAVSQDCEPALKRQADDNHCIGGYDHELSHAATVRTLLPGQARGVPDGSGHISLRLPLPCCARSREGERRGRWTALAAGSSAGHLAADAGNKKMTACAPISGLLSVPHHDRYALFRAMVSEHAQRCRRCIILLSNPRGGGMSQACLLRVGALAACLSAARLEVRAEENSPDRPLAAAIIRGRKLIHCILTSGAGGSN
jgi:hypothetical protein